MSTLDKSAVQFTVSNYTPHGTHVVKPDFELLRIEDKKWRLTTAPIQVNVNDPQHSGEFVANCGRYVSANFVFDCPSDFTAVAITHTFVGAMYTAYVSNGARFDWPEYIGRTAVVSYDRSDHQQRASITANQQSMMGTFGIKFEVILQELPAAPEDRAHFIAAALM